MCSHTCLRNKTQKWLRMLSTTQRGPEVLQSLPCTNKTRPPSQPPTHALSLPFPAFGSTMIDPFQKHTQHTQVKRRLPAPTPATVQKCWLHTQRSTKIRTKGDTLRNTPVTSSRTQHRQQYAVQPTPQQCTQQDMHPTTRHITLAICSLKQQGVCCAAGSQGALLPCMQLCSHMQITLRCSLHSTSLQHLGHSSVCLLPSKPAACTAQHTRR